ncbi:MAG: hypothetical protein ACE5EV_04150 [Gaiellales bacterium]
MLVCPGCDRPTRVSHEVREGKDGVLKRRVCGHADCRETVERA